MSNSFDWILQLKFLNVLEEIEIFKIDQYYFYTENNIKGEVFMKNQFLIFSFIHGGFLSSQVMVSWGM